MKQLFTLLALCFFFVGARATGFVTVDGLKYLVDTDAKSATLVANSYSGDIVVPEKVAVDGESYPVVSLGDGCFKDCSTLSSISIPSSVTSLGNSCFSGCSKLKAISIPESVTSIGVYCFYSCQSLTSISIPSSITNLENACFQNCRNLQSVTLPSSVTKLGSYCFFTCEKLGTIAIPSSVTSLGKYCFGCCSSMTSITVPSSVTSLDDYCFQACSSLTQLDIPSSVTSLGNYCFSGCSNLSSIAIPSSVTALGKYCLKDCSSLQTISLPSSITEVGYECFSGCSALESVYSYATTPPTVVPDFSYYYLGKTSNTILYVPSSSINDYKEAKGWADFSYILAISGTEETETRKCEMPTVIYVDEKLKFESATPNAEYHYTLTCADVASDAYCADGNVVLEAAYNISAYATADGYSASNKATATLYWTYKSIGDESSVIAATKRGVVISANDGFVRVSGLDEGEKATFYASDGNILATSTAISGVATASLTGGQVVVVKVGEQSFKISL